MKNLIQKINTDSGYLIGALLFSNFLNLLFNIFLGRVLSLEDFGLVTLVNSFYLLFGIIFNALSITVNHRVAYLSTQVSNPTGVFFAKRIYIKGLLIGGLFTILWIISTGFISKFFNLWTFLPILFFTPVFILGSSIAVQKGLLQGSLNFVSVGAIFLIEAFTKLGIAGLFVLFGIASWVYLSIPISIVITSGLAFFITSRITVKLKVLEKPEYHSFPRRFFVASILNGISTIMFLSLDLILVMHFLSATSAGVYALLSSVGKMIYFFGSILNGFLVTFVSREEGRKKDTNPTFYKFFAASFALVGIAYIFLNGTSGIILPLLFGDKMTVILPFIPFYTLAISLFTLSGTFVIYHLARKQYLFSLLAISMAILMVIGINIYHKNINQIVQVLLFVSLLNFFITVIFHLLQKNGKFILRNIIDLIDVFYPLPVPVVTNPSKKSILIFNWRDTKHKYAGGAEVYIHELAKRWVKDGHFVTLFCGNDSLCSRNETVDGVQVIRRGGFYFVYIWAFLYYFTRFRGRYDTIIDAQNGIPFFTPLFAKEKIFALMFHVHQEVFRKSLSKPLAFIATVLENRIMPWVYKDVKFITISESTKKEMEKLGLGLAGIEIVYPGISLEKLKPGKKSQNPLVLYVGRLKYYKSLNVFIKTAKAVLEKIPEVQFVIAGDGEEKKGLEKLVRRFNLERKITFLGKVSEEKKVKLYQKAWVLVNPSFMEGWGITSIEANACGTPVVASNVPGLRDSVNNPHSGFLVPYGDVDSFVNKIILLLKDNKLRNKMSETSIHWAKKFDWGESSKKGIQLIESL